LDFERWRSLEGRDDVDAIKLRGGSVEIGLPNDKTFMGTISFSQDSYHSYLR
jgi:hypothetical protein